MVMPFPLSWDKALKITVRAAVPLVRQKGWVGEALFFGVAEQNHFLILYTVFFVILAMQFLTEAIGGRRNGGLSCDVLLENEI